MRSTDRLLLATLAAVGAFLVPATAQAGNHGAKVDSALASAVDASLGSFGKGNLHVLVHGTGLGGVNGLLGLSARNDLDLVGAESLTVSPTDVDRLAAQPGVSFLTLDSPVVPTDGGADPAAPHFSALDLLTVYPVVDGAASLWAAGTTGDGVGIAVIDSGVTPRRDFGSRLVQVKLAAQDGTRLDDGVGHGSLVAGVAAGASASGKYVGVAPGATVFAVNVAKEDGVYTSDVIAGLRWVLQNAGPNNIRVVNLSLSQTSPSQYNASTLDAAVEKLWKAGIVVVASAGNLGPDSMLYAPANDPFVITVGASDPNDTLATADDTLAPWSSSGQTQAGYAKPDVVAPGRHVYSTVPTGSWLHRQAPVANVATDGDDTYLRMNGTSFSAPQVAGAAALLLQQRPGLTPDQVKWVLTTSARPVAGSDAGALDVARASTLVASPSAANRNVPYSSWGAPGNSTVAFVNAVSAAIRATAYERSAGVWERFATNSCAHPPAATAKARDVARFWTNCAKAWERAGDAWDDAADGWGDASLPDKAAAAAKNAGDAWQEASDAYRSALLERNATASWDRAMASWDHMASWDRMASWDHMASWDRMASWDTMASWDALASWD